MRKIIFTMLLTLSFITNNYTQSKCDTLIFNSYGSKIQSYFYASNKTNSPTLIFTQGFFENGDIWNIGKVLSQNGINVFSFDFRGCFNSEGKQGLVNSQEDIYSALTFLKSSQMINNYNIDTTKITIGGYSYGGHMSLLFAIYHPEVNSVISVSGGDLGIFADFVKKNEKLKKGYVDFFESIKKPNGPVDFAFDNPIEELLLNQNYFYILNQVESLSNVNLLITGGLDDSVVNLENYILPLYRKIKKNSDVKVKCIVYETDHSYKNVSNNLIRDIVNWLKEK